MTMANWNTQRMETIQRLRARVDCHGEALSLWSRMLTSPAPNPLLGPATPRVDTVQRGDGYNTHARHPHSRCQQRLTRRRAARSLEMTRRGNGVPK